MKLLIFDGHDVLFVLILVWNELIATEYQLPFTWTTYNLGMIGNQIEQRESSCSPVIGSFQNKFMLVKLYR